MNRVDAKAKVAVMISNFVSPARRAKLPEGTLDRATDRILVNSAATSDLEQMDPNDDLAVGRFLTDWRQVFVGR